VLFYTGISRKASAILKEQNDRTMSDDGGDVNQPAFLKELGQRSLKALEAGDLERFAAVDEHWQQKEARSVHVQSPGGAGTIWRWPMAPPAGKRWGGGGGFFFMPAHAPAPCP